MPRARRCCAPHRGPGAREARDALINERVLPETLVSQEQAVAVVPRRLRVEGMIGALAVRDLLLLLLLPSDPLCVHLPGLAIGSVDLDPAFLSVLTAVESYPRNVLVQRRCRYQGHNDARSLERRSSAATRGRPSGPVMRMLLQVPSA